MFYMSKAFRIRRSRPTRRLSPESRAQAGRHGHALVTPQNIAGMEPLTECRVDGYGS